MVPFKAISRVRIGFRTVRAPNLEAMRMTTRSENGSHPRNLPSRSLHTFTAAIGWLCLVAAGSGCTDGPLFHLKKLNPYIQNQWRQDREKVIVPSQRVAEMRLLKGQLASLPEDEQSKWVGTLSEIVKTETSPELRREAVLALKSVHNRPDAVATMATLSRDKSDFVRLAVVDGLQKSTAPESTSTLLAMASSDSSTNVRLQATQALGYHRSDAVKEYLASKLEDKNPAMQYHVSLALKEYTGKNYGGDMEAWRSYLQGEEVPEPRVSLAETLQSMLPLSR
jgi:hypothetical protein